MHIQSSTLRHLSSECTDFEFIKEVLTKPCVPDSEEYNTKKMQESGKAAKHKTKVIYKPLIDKTDPSTDPSTILTAMCDFRLGSKSLSSCAISNCIESPLKSYRTIQLNGNISILALVECTGL